MSEERKKYELIVNAQPKPWMEKTINYLQVVELAFPGSHKPSEIFTVQYSHGPEKNRNGTLVEGQPAVEVKSGMVFDVTRTDRS